MIRLTFISDTHNRHKQITNDLPGGDILIHAGDISSMGYQHEIDSFCKWFDKIDNYKQKIFIAGNHDWGFQDSPNWCKEYLKEFESVEYLEDNLFVLGDDYDKTVKIYGSPWQPEFYNWAFNLPRNGSELTEKWNQIPVDTDILITHGPAWGYVDKILGQTQNLGCELLVQRIKTIKPKIHVCGHIHTGRGYVFDGDTHFFNAAVLDERYTYTQPPMTVDWDPETNEIHFI